jgi:hypothetical protein
MRFMIFAVAFTLSACSEPVYMWTKAGPDSLDHDSQACKAATLQRLKDTPANYIVKEGSYHPYSGEWARREYNSCMRAAGYTPS